MKFYKLVVVSVIEKLKIKDDSSFLFLHAFKDWNETRIVFNQTPIKIIINIKTCTCTAQVKLRPTPQLHQSSSLSRRK